MAYQFDFDGVTWRCRDRVPDALWAEWVKVQTSSKKKSDLATRLRAGDLLFKIVEAVVYEPWLLMGMLRDEAHAQRFCDEVAPWLSGHYRETQGPWA